MTSNAKAEGRFDKSDFIYIAKDDEYQCPAGERAIYRFTSARENGYTATSTGPAPARSCPMKEQCTTSDYRRIRRWEHEEVLEACSNAWTASLRDDAAKTHHRARVRDAQALDGLDALPDARLEHVSTEMSLHVLAYNLKRLLTLLGVEGTLKAMRLARG